MVKPEFFDDPTIGDLSPLARLFFIGLWTQADREGRLEDDTRRLKARLFPYDDVDVELLAAELHAKHMIRRYAAEDGRHYIWICNFVKHQRPHPKEPASVIPPCPRVVVEKHGEPCKNGPDPSESGVLILDSGTRNLRTQKDQNLPTHKARRGVHAEGFDEFWNAYPRRKSKGQAEKAWIALKPSHELQATILEAIARQQRSDDWRKDGGQFIPYPATWLRAKCWEDEDGRPRPRAVEKAEDWFLECGRLHNHECNGQYGHSTRMAIDAGKVAAS